MPRQSRDGSAGRLRVFAIGMSGGTNVCAQVCRNGTMAIKTVLARVLLEWGVLRLALETS
jgi:hypothetical protein